MIYDLAVSTIDEKAEKAIVAAGGAVHIAAACEPGTLKCLALTHLVVFPKNITVDVSDGPYTNTISIVLLSRKERVVLQHTISSHDLETELEFIESESYGDGDATADTTGNTVPLPASNA